MEESGVDRDRFIREVLEVYRKTPGTMGVVRRHDRLVAAQLDQRCVSLTTIENSLVLATARRMIRPAGSLPLGPIRSLAYFLPVIEEVIGMHASPDYFRYLRHKIARLAADR
ncbi:MAG: hypothetical protein C4342_04185 [Armatimonadota bacterium]